MTAANTNSTDLRQGVVKSFGAGGYGFIGDPTLESSVFVHHTAIQARPGEWRCLWPGQHVTYELVRGPRGLTAQRVTVVRQQREAV